MIAQLEKPLCPVFLERPESNRVDQLGTAVLIEIQETLFLLTAAHVTDHQDKGTLLVPGRNDLIAPYGYFAHIPVAGGKARDKDHLDIAYYRLENDVRNDLHPDLKPLRREDIAVFESLSQGDIYSFSGFPHRKTRTHGNTVITELFSYTGCAVSDETYQQLGYDPCIHIVVKFDRKKSYSTQGGLTAPPLPHGVSGGGIFAWRKDFVAGGNPDDRRLVGIAHTFHGQQQCLAGTRVNAFLSCIFRNNPALLQKGEPTDLPMLTGLAWYRREEWERLRNEFDDGDQLQRTWHEWRHAAERGIDYLAARGQIVSPVELGADEIESFCESRGLPNVSATRILLVNEKLIHAARERDF